MPISKERLGLLIGPLLFLLTLLLDSPSDQLEPLAWRCSGLAAWMALWWMTEAVPLPVTSFIPLVICPLSGIQAIKPVASSYSHPLIFLFMGGFILSIAIEKCGLHLRIARAVIASVGSNARLQVGSIMLVTAFLSMWISNTATAVMMLPIALSIASLLNDSQRNKSQSSKFTSILLLSVAYSASIGGLATIIGTPPNALLVAYLESNYGIQIGFSQWMLFGVPFSSLFLLITWVYLTRGTFESAQSSEATAQIRDDLRAMGAMSFEEKAVFTVFALTATAWISRIKLAKLTGLEITDTGIAMTAALILFLIPKRSEPGKRLLEWEAMKRLPWGVLVLFGGGLALASSIKASGLAVYIGLQFQSLEGLDLVWIAAIAATVVVFLTEVTSNTATAAGLLPLIGPVAISLGAPPTELAIPAAMAASCAFMLPVATPPNAIVFSSGDLKIGEMIRAGFALNILAILMIILSAKWVIPLVF